MRKLNWHSAYEEAYMAGTSTMTRIVVSPVDTTVLLLMAKFEYLKGFNNFSHVLRFYERLVLVICNNKNP